MVSGLSRLASTMRSRSCPSDQRRRRPSRSGASVPCNRSSGNGPEWQSRHRPTCRLATMARPRAASPLAPVSEAGIASPTMVKRSSASCADSRQPHRRRRRRADSAVRDGDLRTAAQPNTSLVMVLNQPSANSASCARTERGASTGLTPPAPGTSVSTPLTG